MDMFLSDPALAPAAVFITTAAAWAQWHSLLASVRAEAASEPFGQRKRQALPDKYSKLADCSDVDTIIIGSGMSGLSCAAILARLGRKVLVLEQHQDVCGGGTHEFTLEGYRFGSGLHYTVPWSVPIFALTCLKKPRHCSPFDLIREEDETIDKIYLVPPSQYVCNEGESQHTAGRTLENSSPFRTKHKEAHISELYRQFPEEHAAIDQFMRASTDSMMFVKLYLFARLLPKWLQKIYWKLVPQRIVETAHVTAKELLPRWTKNKRLVSLLSSMWIDTGARPDKACFMLTSSVFRGIAMEGGCYPADGSEVMAQQLVSTIKKYGGRVFVKAMVQRIIVESGRVAGVQLQNGTVIRSKQGVVSSAGYHNTMQYLLPQQVTESAGITRELSVPQSMGYVMVNIGLDASAEALGIKHGNTWHIPVDEHNDIFPPLTHYFSGPMKPHSEFPTFITFPSLKNSKWAAAHPNMTSAQMLIMAPYEWFEQYKSLKTMPGAPHTLVDLDRTGDYDVYKKEWAERCKRIFLKYYPKAANHLKLVDVSTPLTIESYLSTPKGGGVGLDVTPTRYLDQTVYNSLDCVVDRLPGLYLTGQDTIGVCGVTLAQLSGVITAFRMEGFMAAASIVLKSVLLGDAPDES